MPLIIEGSDCLGKTTAAKLAVELANENYAHPAFYGHMSRPPASFNFFSDYTRRTAEAMVQDRFHLGALVWHEGKLPSDRLRRLEGWLFSQGSVVVVLYHSNKQMYRELLDADDRSQMFDKDTLIKANAKYRDMALGSGPVVDFSWDCLAGYPTEEVVRQWTDEWYMRRSACKHWNQEF
jgi:hypothetical protein